MSAHIQTIEMYISTYSPRYKPCDQMGVDEYLERALSMISDCYNLALWEQNDRKIFRGMSHAFPKFNGYAPLRLAVQTTKGATAISAIEAISIEIGALVGLREHGMVLSPLHAMKHSLLKCTDVKLLDIPKRLDALHELFRTAQDFSVIAAQPNDILAELPFKKFPDKKYTYQKFTNVLNFDGVGILGDQEPPKKWRAVAYTGFDKESTKESRIFDCDTKAQAIEWGKGIIDNDPMIIQHTAESISIYPTQNIIVVRIKGMAND